MAELKLIFKTKTIKYSGLFNFSKVHLFLNKWFANHNFDMVEELTEEQVLPEGKQIIYEHRPYKKFTDFAKAVIFLDVIFRHVQDVTIDVDGVKKQMNKGDIEIKIRGFVETDYENKWETKPFYYFFKVVAEKFFLGGHRSYYNSYVNKMCQLLFDETKSMLNIQKLKV